MSAGYRGAGDHGGERIRRRSWQFVVCRLSFVNNCGTGRWRWLLAGFCVSPLGPLVPTANRAATSQSTELNCTEPTNHITPKGKQLLSPFSFLSLSWPLGSFRDMALTNPKQG